MHPGTSLPPRNYRDRTSQRSQGRAGALLTALALLLVLGASLMGSACSSEGGSAASSVTDLLGRSVELEGAPESIVTTHPTATETLYRAGGSAVGRDAGSKYPEEVTGLPTVGSAYNISAEAVAALEPDLVVIEALTQPGLVAPLEQLGIPVVAVRAASLEDISRSLELLGEIIGTGEAAAQAVSEIEDQISAAAGALPESRSVLVLIADAQNNVYAGRPDSYPGLVAQLAGLENLAAGLPDAGGMYAGYALLSAEQAAQRDPDIILTITPAPAPAPRLSAVLTRLPVFKDMAAVKAGSVVELDPVLFLQAQGPRIGDAVAALIDIAGAGG